MSFVYTVRRARQLVEQEGRLSLRALQREFSLDAETVEAVVAELVEVQHVALREDQTIVWAGRPETADIAPTGAPANRLTGSPDTGERRQLTVLFCDLVGSTELAARMDPEDWRSIIADYHRAVATTVERFGGHVAKYLGDGLLVYFGYPQAHEDDAERAVRAGLAVAEGVKGLGVTGLGKSDPLTPNPLTPNPLSVRTGIHTGLTVIGDAGERADVFGDTVNLASRIEGVAKPDTVVISDSTLRLVRGIFVIEELGAQPLKGFAEPIPLFRVVQPSGVRSRLDLAAGKLTPFVGRQSELGTLLDAWERVLDGTGQTVLVYGEPGVGKSRLAYELRERLGADPHTWLECRCSPYTQGTAFHPVIELVTQGLLLTSEDTPAQRLTQLEQALGWANLSAVETLPLLAEFLSLPPEAGFKPLEMSPELKRRKTFETLAAWTLRLGEIQPVLLLLEDLHWCDPSSLELFGRLIEQSPTARVLMLCTARPEFSSPWPARSNLQMATLGRLTKRQAGEMVAQMNPRASFPEEVAKRIAEQADGVPLYVEELTRMVRESGILTERHGRYELTAPFEGLAIPSTLQDSLMARLDRLSAAKEVAQRAAVLGREFPYVLLSAVAGLDEPALRQGLLRLVQAELVFVRGEPPEALYTFKHALVQEAAYESLLRRTRQELHARAVDVLLERFPERAASEPEVVARHAEAAGRLDDAVNYYQRAGEQAQARSAHEEAIGHLRRAIRLLATAPKGVERDAGEVRLQITLGASLVAARGYPHEETGAAYRRALDICEALDDPAQAIPALNALSLFLSTGGDINHGLTLAERALVLAERQGDDAQQLAAHFQIAYAFYMQGKFRLACIHGEQALRLYDAPQHRGLAFTYGQDQCVGGAGMAAWSLWQLGHPDRALVRARETVALAQSLAHPFTLAFALFIEFFVRYGRGDTAAQRERAEEIVALANAQGFPMWLGMGTVSHGIARVAAGEHEALAELVEGMTLLESAGAGQAGAPWVIYLLAEAQQTSRQYLEAFGTVESALEVGARTGQPFWDADLHRLKAELVLETGGGEAEAEELLRRALDIARAQEAKSFELRAATSLARLLRDQNRVAEARAELAPVYGWFTEGFDTQDLKDAKALLEELL